MAEHKQKADQDLARIDADMKQRIAAEKRRLDDDMRAKMAHYEEGLLEEDDGVL